MTPARCITWIAVMTCAALLWGGLHRAKESANDPVNLTCLLFRQARSVRASAAPIAESRLFVRYRFPEGDPDRQSWLFEDLWQRLQRSAREEVTPGKELQVRTEDGENREGRTVRVRGKDRDGEPVDMLLTWVRFRNTWYIHDCEDLR